MASRNDEYNTSELEDYVVPDVSVKELLSMIPYVLEQDRVAAGSPLSIRSHCFERSTLRSSLYMCVFACVFPFTC